MNSIGIQLRISDLLFAVQKRWKIIVSLTFLGLVFGLLLSGMNYVQSAMQSYQINGSFVINAVNSQGKYSGGSLAPSKTDMTLATDLYDTVYYLLRSDRLLYQIINEQQMLGVSASDIRNGLSISRYNETTIINMKLTWDNGEEGLQLWQAIIDTANKLLSEIVQVGRLQVFNEPETKMISSRSTNLKTWMVLPVLGFGAGMGFAVIELLMRPTLINVKDVETVFGLETIGIIPYDSAYFSNNTSLLVSDEKTSSEVTQNFSAAAYILRNRIGLNEKNHCFYITSATGQEGRTSIAANLAIQLSDMERHTLLIDFDYKNPMLGSMLDYSHSLNALYRGEIQLNDAITTLTGYLDILPMVMEHNLIYLDSTIVDMISQLRDQYHYIIIDAPPVGKESETLSLNQVANTVLFVARYDTASIPEIQGTLEKLDKSGIRILGCIVNGVKTSRNVIFGTGKEEAAKKTKATAKKKKKKQPLPGAKKEDAKQSAEEMRDLTGSDSSKGKKQRKTGSTPKRKSSAKIRFFEDQAENPPASSEAQTEMPPASSEAQAPETPAEAPAAPRGETPETASYDTEPERTTDGTPAQIQPTADLSDMPAQPPDSRQDTAEYPPADDAYFHSQEPAADHTEPAAPGFTDWENADHTQSADVIPYEPEPVGMDSVSAQAAPAEPEKPPEKKRGLFGRTPRQPREPKKPAKPSDESGKDDAPPPEPTAIISAKPADAKKTKAASQKKKKTRTPFWRRHKKKEEDPFEKIKAESTVINKSRNVFEDLMDEGPSAQSDKTDSEMIEELLRMGLDGSWTNSDQTDSDEKKPNGGKRNLFEDP